MAVYRLNALVKTGWFYRKASTDVNPALELSYLIIQMIVQRMLRALSHGAKHAEHHWMSTLDVSQTMK